MGETASEQFIDLLSDPVCVSEFSEGVPAPPSGQDGVGPPSPDAELVP